MLASLSRSLSLRLLVIFALVAFLLVGLLVALFSQGLSSQWRRSIAPHLVQYVRYVQQDLGQPPDPARAQRLAEALPVTISIYKDDEFVFATDDASREMHTLRFRPLPPGMRRELGMTDASVNRIQAAVARERRRDGTILRLESGDDTVYYRLGPPVGKRPLPWDGLPLGLLAVLLVLVGGYLAIRHQLAPIRHIQAGVRRISEGEVSHRLEPTGRDDLAELAHSIDDMTIQLGGMLDAKRELLLAISHELRSPLARARLATELLPENSRQREGLEKDLAEMASLIDDLTESERLRTPHTTLQRISLDFEALVRDELSRFDLEPEIVDETLDGHRTDTLDRRNLEGDAVRLRMLVRNLIKNAVHHGKDGDAAALVTVRIRNTASTVQLDVIDRGPGIPADQLDKVTEPFHRLDPSRTRSSGGIGLGLSLAKLVAEAHGGSLTLVSDPTARPGTRATVILPRSGT